MSKILITISFHFSFKSNIPNSIILVNVINYDKNPEGQNNLPQQSGGGREHWIREHRTS